MSPASASRSSAQASHWTSLAIRACVFSWLIRVCVSVMATVLSLSGLYGGPAGCGFGNRFACVEQPLLVPGVRLVNGWLAHLRAAHFQVAAINRSEKLLQNR